MNINPKVIICTLAISISALAACKKSTTTTTTTTSNASVNDLLTAGTWHFSRQFQDANINFKQDADELIADSSSVNETFLFQVNGILIVTDNGSFLGQEQWELVNNGSGLRFLDTSAGSTPEFLIIQSIDNHTLAIKDTTDAAIGNTTWTYLTK